MLCLMRLCPQLVVCLMLMSDASITTPAAKRISEKREKTTSSEASSDDAEDSYPIAASLTKGMFHAVCRALALALALSLSLKP